MPHGSRHGKPDWPDLSNVGRDMTVDQIREALLQPSARIVPGYEIVTVQLRDGKTIRGFARSRSNFDIRLQDFDGKIHLLQEAQISAIQDERESVMRPLEASAEELQNLIAYLSRLTGAQAGVPTVSPGSEEGGIDSSRIMDPRPGDWLSYNGKLSGNRDSDLAQIDTTNVSKLGLKWIF